MQASNVLMNILHKIRCVYVENKQTHELDTSIVFRIFYDHEKYEK